ncbi:uncharacterized protein M421DRAFT_422704 [Didymella exigua CBS 183.55]|uniref:Carbohydrate-binding module family 50 protein n=1 Tax=Didymella exigua CBS 183.55 TaxID=1150837 RepID=A0A6A5RGF8_9PLEO|nr:uncharacterized protein M421DRAFT_422704 [Didymella exigua CBS 183.55]KAF1926360.1 hypothetical protein M421DRAFT_422704 [Didymella exigua CBS 183.55]
MLIWAGLEHSNVCLCDPRHLLCGGSHDATLFHRCTSTERGKCQVQMRVDTYNWQRSHIWWLSTSGTTDRYAPAQQKAQAPPVCVIKSTTVRNTLSILFNALVSLFTPLARGKLLRHHFHSTLLVARTLALELLHLRPSLPGQPQPTTVMVVTTSLIAACSIFALSFAAPIHNAASRAIVARDAYIMFGGDGTMALGWPSQKQWLSWDDAWKASLDTILNSCQVEGWGENNSNAETQAIKDSIVDESKSSGIPKEFILAIMMQESKGCVRAPTTRWSHDNPGLMQSAQGTGSCNPDGNPISPCSSTKIRQMIHDGTNGDGLETTLTQCVADAGTTDDSKWYKAARLFNAGRITDNNLGIGPTPCYASDIANRLTTPLNWSPCDNAVIGSLSSAQGTIANGNTNDVPEEVSAPATIATAEYPTAPASTPTPIPTPATAPSVFVETPAAGSTKPDLIIDGVVTGCTNYYIPQSGSTCASAPIDFAILRSLNTQLNSDCTNLWAGYAYCIAA